MTQEALTRAKLIFFRHGSQTDSTLAEPQTDKVLGVGAGEKVCGVILAKEFDASSIYGPAGP